MFIAKLFIYIIRILNHVIRGSKGPEGQNFDHFISKRINIFKSIVIKKLLIIMFFTICFQKVLCGPGKEFKGRSLKHSSDISKTINSSFITLVEQNVFIFTRLFI